MRFRLLILTLFSALALAGALAASPPGRADLIPLTPYLDCTFHNPTGDLTAVFGYNNENAQAFNIQAQFPTNYFAPDPKYRGQPETFYPGEHHDLFSVAWDGSYDLSWTLLGTTVTATATANPCYHLIFRGAWDSSLLYLPGDTVRTENGSAWVATSENTDSAPDLLNTNWELFAGGGDAHPAFPSTDTHTFGPGNKTVVHDPNVSASSTIIVQYVNGAGAVATSVNNVSDGTFTATGTAGKHFKYVVYH